MPHFETLFILTQARGDTHFDRDCLSHTSKVDKSQECCCCPAGQVEIVSKLIVVGHVCTLIDDRVKMRLLEGEKTQNNAEYLHKSQVFISPSINRRKSSLKSHLNIPPCPRFSIFNFSLSLC